MKFCGERRIRISDILLRAVAGAGAGGAWRRVAELGGARWCLCPCV